VAKMSPVYMTHPLRGITVTVRIVITRRFKVRLWLTRKLIWLAVWVSGGTLDLIEEGND
jgi:hypothetical protein